MGIALSTTTELLLSEPYLDAWDSLVAWWAYYLTLLGGIWGSIWVWRYVVRLLEERDSAGSRRASADFRTDSRVPRLIDTVQLLWVKVMIAFISQELNI